MKNLFAFGFLALALTVASCGGNQTSTEATTDSLATEIDSAAAVVDSAAAVVDSAAAVVDSAANAQ